MSERRLLNRPEEWGGWADALSLRIGKEIERRGISQAEAARIVGNCDKGDICEIVNCRPRSGLELRVRVALALGIKLDLRIDGRPAISTTGGRNRKVVKVLSHDAIAA